MKSVKGFNIARFLSSHFVESKLILALIPAILLFGLIGLLLTPREENPQIVVPAAEVIVPMPGSTPLEVENLLLTPLENHLNSMQAVKHTYGLASEGFAKIQVEFEVGEDKTDAFVRLYDQVLHYRAKLPPQAGEPHVRLIDADDVPFMVITLASAEYDRYQLGRMAERMVEHLRSLHNVGTSNVIGNLSDEIRIEIDPTRLQSLGLDMNQLRAHIQAADLDVSLGQQIHTRYSTNNSDENIHLRISHKLNTLEQLKQLVITTDQQHVLHLQDIATIIDAPDTQNTSFTRFHFGRADSRFQTTSGQEMAAVHIAIAKRAGVNAVPLAKKILERIAIMQSEWLPHNIHVVTTRDDGQKADISVNTLIEHLFIAIGVVSLILWIFLGWRAAAIVTVTIPLVFALVIGADMLAGPTLNRLTLYALILALGMLVDDAIVVIENIHRHNQLLPADTSQADYAKAIVDATAEIGNPTTLATFTIITVFLSLLMVTGMLGEYFYPVAFNVPVAMLASLLVAYMVTPWAARRFLPVTHQEHKENWIQRGYRFIFKYLYRYWSLRALFFTSILIALTLSFLQPAWQFIRPQGVAGAVSELGVPLAFLPKDNKNTFLITFHLPDTTPLEKTDRLVRQIEKVVLENPHVLNTQTFVGIPSVIDFNGQLRGSAAKIGEQYADIRVNLTLKSQRETTSIDIVKKLRKQLASIIQQYPDSTIQFVEDPPGPPVAATVLAEIYGHDNKQREALAMQVREEFKNTWDMAEVWASIPTPTQELHFKINQERTRLAGLSVQQVATALQLFLKGDVVNYLHQNESRNPIPIRLLIPHNKRISPDGLAQTFIRNPQGTSVPLSTLVDVISTQQARPIWHQDSERVTYVGGELAGSAPVYAVLDLDKRLDHLPLEQGENGKLTTANLQFIPATPDTLQGYRLHWAGELRLTLDAFRDMGLALGLSLLIIYFLLVAYYQSFGLPIMVMVSIPLGMIGVFPAHWALGQDFTAASMIGVIALAGVVVRNSLLIVDFIREREAQGIPLEQAASDAGALRLIPIMLTTLAIAFGTMIMVPDPVFGGLAIGLIFGAISSAVLTVFVVPLLYTKKGI
jgi:multidrug efflux pump subunit AcrB